MVVLLYCQGDSLSGTQKIPRVKKIGPSKKKKERFDHSLLGWETAKLANPNRTKQTTIITQTTLPFIKKTSTLKAARGFFRPLVLKEFFYEVLLQQKGSGLTLGSALA